MISYKDFVAQICVLFRLNDRQWSSTNPESAKYVSLLDWIIVNDPLQSLGRPKLFLLGLYGRQWSFMEPRLPKYVSYLVSMIVNDLSQILGCPNMCHI